jgi:hypothetical protein
MKTTWTKAEQRRHRKAWVKALREGGYKQGRGMLCNARDGMCCLGVACDISGLGYWEWEPHPGGEGGGGNWVFVDKAGDRNGSTLTTLIRDYYGLQTHAGYFDGGSILASSLAGLNDEGRKRFKTIAKVIESEPEGLFYY